MNWAVRAEMDFELNGVFDKSTFLGTDLIFVFVFYIYISFISIKDIPSNIICLILRQVNF